MFAQSIDGIQRLEWLAHGEHIAVGCTLLLEVLLDRLVGRQAYQEIVDLVLSVLESNVVKARAETYLLGQYLV